MIRAATSMVLRVRPSAWSSSRVGRAPADGVIQRRRGRQAAEQQRGKRPGGARLQAEPVVRGAQLLGGRVELVQNAARDQVGEDPEQGQTEQVAERDGERAADPLLETIDRGPGGGGQHDRQREQDRGVAESPQQRRDGERRERDGRRQRDPFHDGLRSRRASMRSRSWAIPSMASSTRSADRERAASGASLRRSTISSRTS